MLLIKTIVVSFVLVAVASLDLKVPSVNLQIRPESFFFPFFFIFNSVSLHEKAKF